MRARALALLALALVALGPFGSVQADGEAGVVIQNGDNVQTYCVPFEGDSITGSDLLQAAGLTVEDVGGGSRTVCAIGDTGCHDAGDFASCFCQCQGADCVYWAFFTEKYGQGWIYSSLAYNLLRARDGDLEGWKWGKGNPNSAPAPVPMTFETVCGHAPNGGLALPSPTPTATETQPAPTPTASPPVTTATSTDTTSAAPPASPTAAGAGATATATTASASAVPSVATIPATGVPTPTLPPAPGATVVKPPATGARGSDGGANLGLIAFGVVAGALVLAIGAAVVWRERRGA
jgi:hypothetical protein